jgi:hypothetical protein
MDPLQEYVNTGDTASLSVYGTKWVAKTFSVSTETHYVSQVNIKVFRVGSPGTMTAHIRSAPLSIPSGTDMTSGTADANYFTTDTNGEWILVTMSPQVLLTQYEDYVVALSCAAGDASNYVGWRYY